MSRMLGARCKSFCPICKGPAGPDCPDVAVPDRRTVRAQEKRSWNREAANDR